MLGREGIAALIPHQGTMCLLDRVIEWDNDRIVLATATHRALDNPLRSGGRLRAVHLCEYGAQAMAVHGGLVAQSEARRASRGPQVQPGFLVSLRDVKLNVDYIEALGGELRVSARRLLEAVGSWQYAFAVEHEGQELASGRAAAMARAG